MRKEGSYETENGHGSGWQKEDKDEMKRLYCSGQQDELRPWNSRGQD